MKQTLVYPSVNLLRNQIDFTKAPFSDRGSRLMLFISPGGPSLHIRLAERLTNLDPNIEAYLKREPFIQNLCLMDEDGNRWNHSSK